MQRMCSLSARVGLVLFLVVAGRRLVAGARRLDPLSARRSFPDIAGDIVGTQTYTYDPVTQTGTFEVVNAPHLISLGPSVKDMVHMLPDQDGTLSQSLKMKLDRNGRLVKSPTTRSRSAGTRRHRRPDLPGACFWKESRPPSARRFRRLQR